VSNEFTLRQIRYFIAVAESGTLSAAAEVLFVSQPALSSAITELESALGVQLCVRQKSRGVTLTPNGQAFYLRARQLIRSVDELAWSTRSTGGALRGPLTIGSYLSLAPDVIPHFLTEFPKSQPGLSLDYREGDTDELERMLLKGEVDLAILYDFDLDPRIKRKKLVEKTPRLVLPRDHRLRDATQVDLRDIQEEPFIQIVTSPAVNHTSSIFAEAGITPVVAYHATNAELADQMVAKGLGYTILLNFPQRQGAFRELGLISKAITPSPPTVNVVVAWPSTIELNARALAFIDFVSAQPLPLHDPADQMP
jgi:DNA-binding transcriptional LysR family regulator